MSVYCLNLPYSDQDLLEEFYLDKHLSRNIVYLNNLVDVQKRASTDQAAKDFFLVIDEEVCLEELEEFLSKFVNEVVNVIIKGKLFEHLLLCQRYNVHYVYQYRLDKASLESAYFRKQYFLSDKLEASLPKNVTSLFARAIKVKNDSELYLMLNRYLSSSKAVKKFSYLIEHDGNYRIHGEKIAADKKEALFEYNWKEKYIGEIYTFPEGKGSSIEVAFPVMIQDNLKEVIFLELEKKALKDILNDYFFNYLQSVLIYRINKTKELRLQELVNLDEVTGAFNSRKLMEDLGEQIEKHQLRQEKFCVLFIDIDHFKNVNDSYGHLAGSRLLVDLSIFLKKQLRESDSVYRYGGDEFVIIIPYLDTSVVSTVAERILKKVKEHTFKVTEEEDYKMSISIGVSEYPTDALTEKEIIKFADEMMYKSKKSGRGKVFYLNKVSNC